MEKLKIFEVLNCNRVLFKIFQQKNVLNASFGFKLFKISKIFDEVEEYVVNTMYMTFDSVDLEKLNDEQINFYNVLISSEIELDYDRVDSSLFEKNDELMLTLEDISNLQIIVKE